MAERITVEMNMAAFDRLPMTLKRYLDQCQTGLDAVTTEEFYKMKLGQLTPLYTESEVQQMVMKALDQYQRQQGVQDFRKLVSKLNLRRRRL
jgi:uncharacterized HAD superfamily protein